MFTMNSILHVLDDLLRYKTYSLLEQTNSSLSAECVSTESLSTVSKHSLTFKAQSLSTQPLQKPRLLGKNKKVLQKIKRHTMATIVCSEECTTPVSPAPLRRSGA